MKTPTIVVEDLIQSLTTLINYWIRENDSERSLVNYCEFINDLQNLKCVMCTNKSLKTTQVLSKSIYKRLKKYKLRA